MVFRGPNGISLVGEQLRHNHEQVLWLKIKPLLNRLLAKQVDCYFE